jgi:single-strand selective monofunctional uracil DNA glycosylase
MKGSAVKLAEIAATLVSATRRLRFGAPVACVYHPLEYAIEPYLKYLRIAGDHRREVVLVGMNPGPWGMAQTGIPFGEVNVARTWLGVEAPVGRPRREHPHRPVQGFGCRRSEVSGARLWGWARDAFQTPDRFFQRFFVANYCPLCFLEDTGRNRTPDKLPASERRPLFVACDEALRRTVECLSPRIVVGVGRFAEARARIALDGIDVEVGHVLHPSPASPAANRDWPGQVAKQFEAMGIACAVRRTTMFRLRDHRVQADGPNRHHGSPPKARSPRPRQARSRTAVR